MWGAIVGDFIGSVYENVDLKGHDLPLITNISHFTDDSILTIATMAALLKDCSFESQYRYYANKYPAQYGAMFSNWLIDDIRYDSYGNGAAMRVSPIALASDSAASAMHAAKDSALCTHSSAEALLSVQAVTSAIFLARQGSNAAQIQIEICERFYPQTFDIDYLHKNYQFTSRASESVPIAIFLALQSTSFKDCMRKGLYVGGDTDTILAIAGSIAEQLYGIPIELLKPVQQKLDLNYPELIKIAVEFDEKNLGH